MDRVELKEQKCTDLFGGFAAEGNPDKEFLDILQNFQFGEVSFRGDMDDKTLSHTLSGICAARAIMLHGSCKWLGR